jgi:non-specific serine/threonine protein kinase
MRREVGNLPAELTSFVGRRHEVAQVKRLLSASRLVTLTGVGGVGKTRLALRVAAELRRAFRDGVWLVELDKLHDEALVAQTIAGALGLQAGSSPAAALIEYVADRQLLLVVDNCEHLVDAVAKLADQLLRAAADLRVIATTREPLNVAGETVLPVAPLPAPDAREQLTVAQLTRFPAVSLFTERAAQVVPSFAVTEINKAAVAGICHRLEGLPLAIELAAAQLRVLSPEQVNDRLSDRLGLLTRGSRSNPARQQTLRDCIAWSYELCTQPERRLWARLSVFAGGCELDAVEGICADDGLAATDLLELVAALVQKSVLIAEYHERGVRYRLPETLREYGQDSLRETGEYMALRRRHRDWYEQLTRQADTDWLSPRQVDWMARLHREHANVQVALDFCQSEPGEAEAALRIVRYVWRFHYWAAGLVSEGRYRLDQALARAPEPTIWRAQGLLINSLLAVSYGERAIGQALLKEGTSLAERLDDPATWGYVAFAAGLVTMYDADLPRAIAYLDRGLARLPQGTHDSLRVDLLLDLAIATGLGGDEQRAVAANRQLLALTEANGEFFHRSYALWALGLAVWRQGEIDRATELQQQSLRLRQRLNDRMGNTFCLEALAWIAAAQQHYERAAVLLGAAASLWRSMAMNLDGFQHLVGYQRDCQRRTRQALGEKAFQAAHHSGMTLPPEDAIAYALRQQASPPKPAAPAEAPLTPREMQVARLLAQGRSNKEIAAQLVISQRTAEGHVENILTKLGFTSRAQVAAWSVAAQPDDDAS